jgi:hypothetical protein
MTRLNRSDQVSSGAMRRPASLERRRERVPVGLAGGVDRGEEIDAGVALEGLRNAEALGLERRIDTRSAPGEPPGAGGLRGEAEERGAIGHQHVVSLACPVPFQHRELGVVQGAALAVAIDPGEGEQPRLAGSEKLLAGEFGRGVEVERLPGAVRAQGFRCESMEMRLVAGRGLEGGGFDLDEIVALEKAPDCGRDPVAADEKRPPVGVDVGHPPGGGGEGRHGLVQDRFEGVIRLGAFCPKAFRPERLADSVEMG